MEPNKHRIVYEHLNDEYAVKKGGVDVRELSDEGYQRALEAQKEGKINILRHTKLAH